MSSVVTDASQVYAMSTLILKESGNGQKVVTLQELKSDFDSRFGGNFDSDKIKFESGKLKVEDGVMNTTQWDEIKKTGDKTVPFKITILKGTNKSTDKVAKIAFYRDGSVAIEEL